MKNQTITHRTRVVQIMFGITMLLLFSIWSNTLFAQQNGRTVSGVVTSADGPLLGASVVLKGTTIGVSTNDDGSFTFPQKLHENDVLLVTYFGYENREITIQLNTSYVAPYLEDIPVILHGALRKKSDKTAATSELYRE